MLRLVCVQNVVCVLAVFPPFPVCDGCVYIYLCTVCVCRATMVIYSKGLWHVLPALWLRFIHMDDKYSLIAWCILASFSFFMPPCLYLCITLRSHIARWIPEIYNVTPARDLQDASFPQPSAINWGWLKKRRQECLFVLCHQLFEETWQPQCEETGWERSGWLLAKWKWH